MIGAGNYARSILLPALGRTKATLAAVADINGVAAAHAARKFKAGKAVSDHRLILDDPGIQAVFVLVGHHLHARFVCEALEVGKHVFVEKPLAINDAQLEEVIRAYEKIGGQRPYFSPTEKPGQLPESPPTCHSREGGNPEKNWIPDQARNDKHLSSHAAANNDHSSFPILMVGFNRRFSPHTVKIRELLAGRTEPLCMTLTVNAGFIPSEHWTQDPERGGGRIIGEGCHFIDLLSHLAGSPVTSVSATMVGGNGPIREDKMSILLGFADGSVGTVNYFANGAKSYPKEILEVFSDGRVIRMENFRITTGYGFKGFRSFRTWRQDKGHRAEIAAFVDAVARRESGDTIPISGEIGSCPQIPLIPFEQIVNVTRASFAAVESARTGRTIQI